MEFLLEILRSLEVVGSGLEGVDEQNFEEKLGPLAGRFVGTYGGHGFELVEVKVSDKKLTATKITGDVNVPAGQVTFEIYADGTAKGRIAQTGFQNPMWVPGRLEWDFTDPDEFKFYWRGCGSVSFIRVPNSFELNEQTRMTFIGHNYTRLIQVDGIYYVLPKAHRAADPKAIERIEISTYSSNDEEASLCAVCQIDFQDGDSIGKLTCSHQFHAECIKTWLARKNACPLCMRPL